MLMRRSSYRVSPAKEAPQLAGMPELIIQRSRFRVFAVSQLYLIDGNRLILPAPGHGTKPHKLRESMRSKLDILTLDIYVFI
jgi:hypothetical protein